MNEWYIPITILPGICLLILSTTNIMLELSKEINLLIQTGNDHQLISKKLRQLKTLNRSMVFLYLASASFVVSGLLSGLFESTEAPLISSKYVVIAGIILTLTALGHLIVYSTRAVRIRQDQHQKQLRTE